MSIEVIRATRPVLKIKTRDAHGKWNWHLLYRGKRVALTVADPPERDDEDIVCWWHHWTTMPH